MSSLFSSIDNSIFSLFDSLIFIDASILETFKMETLLGNYQSGILLLSNSLILGFLSYYCIRLIFSHFLSIEIESPIQVIIKLIIFTIIMNYSFTFCYYIIDTTSLISNSILEIFSNMFGKNISFSFFLETANATLSFSDGNFNVFSLDGILKSILSIGIVNSVLSYSFRYILINLFVLLSPFAILTLINQNTSWIFKSWLKAFILMLFLQILIATILVLSLTFYFSSIFNDKTIFNKLVLISSVYTLIKSNDILKELLGGISTNISTNLFYMKN